MGKRRNNYIDIVKGVAIILVVIGHCFQFFQAKFGNLTRRKHCGNSKKNLVTAVK